MCFGGGAVPQAPSEAGQSSASNSIGNSAATAAQNLTGYTAAGSANQNAQTSLAQGQLNSAGAANLGAGQAGLNMYQNTAIPAAQQNIAQSQAWGSPSGVANATADAEASTGNAYNAARLNNQRQLGSYGVDPSQMKSGALNLNANLAQAGAVGNAGYTAGQNRQLQGINLTNQAVGTANQTAGVGAQYGATGASQLANATQLGNQTLSTTTQAQLAPSQFDQTALSGYSTSGNLASQQFGNQLQSAQLANQNNNALMSGLGQGIGMAATYFSDGGAIPNRYDDGGGINVPSISISAPPIASVNPSAQLSSQGGAGIQNQNAAGGLGAGLGALAGRAMSRPSGSPQQSSGDGGLSNALAANVSADGGLQTKHPMSGIPQRSQQMGVPPQVGIPGPWVAANGGSPPGTFVSQGASDGSGIDDQVPAKLSVGEYVIPADVVHAKGKEFFDKLLQRYHMPAQQQRQQMGMH